ncbi:MAG: TolC family protein [Lacipirellulaceae bacterium]
MTTKKLQQLRALLPLLFAVVLGLGMAGCSISKPDEWDFDCKKCEEPLAPGCCPAQLEIDEPCRSGCLADETPIPVGPNEVGTNDEVGFFNLTLEQAITMALQKSPALRDLGGTVLRNPAGIQSVYDPAAAFSDPQFGEEAALSAFDTSFGASMFWDKNDRVANSTFVGDTGVLDQDLGLYTLELTKRAATGSQMAVRHITEYDANNFVGNQFGSSWQTYFDAEIRQPLLQGGGIRFNQIAGPSNQAGVMNGVLIARIRTDISLADFEVGVRNLISNVENAYWDLYFAYYDLDAKKLARDEALALWNSKKVLFDNGDAKRSEVDQALEQYWRFESAVIDAYNGTLVDRTSTNNGSSAGSFRNPGGVRVAERRLRLIMGMPVNSTQLIKPVTTPPDAPVQFDWASCAAEALAHRTELRRQRWRVKQRELELIASKNFLTPRLDLVGRYRWRGFGKDLISQSNATGAPTYASAWGALADGKNDEWRLGVELDVPLGFRRGHAAVRNAELQLVRETTLLKEQERNVLFGLSNAFGEVERAFLILQAQDNRLRAAKDQVTTFLKEVERGNEVTDILLEAQRQLVDSRIRYQQARVEYALAIKNVHFEKGTVLEFNDVRLAESASPKAAYQEARLRRKRRTDVLDYVSRAFVVSGGKTSQSGLTPAGYTEEVSPDEAVPIPGAPSIPAPAEPLPTKPNEAEGGDPTTDPDAAELIDPKLTLSVASEPIEVGSSSDEVKGQLSVESPENPFR